MHILSIHTIVRINGKAAIVLSTCVLYIRDHIVLNARVITVFVNTKEELFRTREFASEWTDSLSLSICLRSGKLSS